MDPSTRPSLWERTIAHPRPTWASLFVGALVYLPVLVAGAALGVTDLMGTYRGILAAPTVITYIIVLGPVMAPLETTVSRSLRQLILTSEADLAPLILRAQSVSRWQEAASVAVGLAFGLAIIGFPTDIPNWPNVVIALSGYAMLGLLAWTAFISVSGTRVLNTLLRQPMRIDPLDRKPFEPIGRYSLATAMAFVGGILIGLVLGSYGTSALTNPRFWLLFLPVSMLPILVFYLNMRPTHRILSTARHRALDEVQRQLRRSFPSLLERLQHGVPTGSLPGEVNALVAYEKELLEASTWPYNPVILRTLVVSVLVPTATLLARRVFEVYIR